MARNHNGFHSQIATLQKHYHGYKIQQYFSGSRQVNKVRTLHTMEREEKRQRFGKGDIKRNHCQSRDTTKYHIRQR